MTQLVTRLLQSLYLLELCLAAPQFVSFLLAKHSRLDYKVFL